MAYNTKTIKRDGSGITPVPQHFNPVTDDFEPQYGRNNAGRVELYGPDGNPIASTDNKLAVRASENKSPPLTGKTALYTFIRSTRRHSPGNLQREKQQHSGKLYGP